MCDLAHAVLIEQFEGDGRAFVTAGDERSPHEFRAMVDALLDGESSSVSHGPPVSAEVQELREELGVA